MCSSRPVFRQRFLPFRDSLSRSLDLFRPWPSLVPSHRPGSARRRRAPDRLVPTPVLARIQRHHESSLTDFLVKGLDVWRRLPHEPFARLWAELRRRSMTVRQLRLPVALVPRSAVSSARNWPSRAATIWRHFQARGFPANRIWLPHRRQPSRSAPRVARLVTRTPADAHRLVQRSPADRECGSTFHKAYRARRAS